MEILYPYSWWKKINLAASAFKLVGQFIQVLPLKGCFIELHLGGDVVGNKVDFVALKNTEGLCPDCVEGGLLRDTVIRKKSQDLPSPVEGFVALANACPAKCLART